MLSKNELKYVRALESGKYRRKHGSFVAEGSTVINEFIKEGWEIESVWAIEGTEIGAADNLKIVSEKELRQLSFQKNPQDAFSVIKAQRQDEILLPPAGFVIACDRIQDPGNLGTIIRIADWYGVNSIVCSEGCADAYGPKVVQSSMGSLARVKVIYTDLGSYVVENNSAVIATSLNGESIYSAQLPINGIILLGNESNGVSENLLNSAGYKIKIPGFGKAESLNVAVACGIICAELIGRRSSLQK